MTASDGALRHVYLGVGLPRYTPGVGVWARSVTEKSTRIGLPSIEAPAL